MPASVKNVIKTAPHWPKYLHGLGSFKRVIETDVMDNTPSNPKWHPLQNRFAPSREALKAIEDKLAPLVAGLYAAPALPLQLELDLGNPK